MEKPTIFFSHSSKDRDAILPIKEKLMKITSGVIQIFMSSDGQSIPFGKNWVHKIEEGLSSAKIMFVFVTPTSIESGWIYFEAGFAYSKGIDVIPVGVGVDIGSIKPPLSMLQGFNITSGESLNNFVIVINKNLDYSFEPKFDEEDFIFLDTAIEKENPLSDFNELFGIADYKIFSSKISPEDFDGREDVLPTFNKMKEYLEQNGYEFATCENADGEIVTLLVNGLRINCSAGSKIHGEYGYNELTISMALYSFVDAYNLFKELVLVSDVGSKAYLRFQPRKAYSYIVLPEMLSAITAKHSEVFTPNKTNMQAYNWKGDKLTFGIFDASPLERIADKKTYVLSIAFDLEKTVATDFIECVSDLLDSGIIVENLLGRD